MTNCTHPIMQLEIGPLEDSSVRRMECLACKAIWHERNWWPIVSAQESVRLLYSELEKLKAEICAMQKSF